MGDGDGRVEVGRIGSVLGTDPAGPPPGSAGPSHHRTIAWIRRCPRVRCSANSSACRHHFALVALVALVACRIGRPGRGGAYGGGHVLLDPCWHLEQECSLPCRLGEYYLV